MLQFQWDSLHSIGVESSIQHTINNILAELPSTILGVINKELDDFVANPDSNIPVALSALKPTLSPMGGIDLSKFKLGTTQPILGIRSIEQLTPHHLELLFMARYPSLFQDSTVLFSNEIDRNDDDRSIGGLSSLNGHLPSKTSLIQPSSPLPLPIYISLGQISIPNSIFNILVKTNPAANHFPHINPDPHGIFLKHPHSNHILQQSTHTLISPPIITLQTNPTDHIMGHGVGSMQVTLEPRAVIDQNPPQYRETNQKLTQFPNTTHTSPQSDSVAIMANGIQTDESYGINIPPYTLSDALQYPPNLSQSSSFKPIPKTAKNRSALMIEKSFSHKTYTPSPIPITSPQKSYLYTPQPYQLHEGPYSLINEHYNQTFTTNYLVPTIIDPAPDQQPHNGVTSASLTNVFNLDYCFVIDLEMNSKDSTNGVNDPNDFSFIINTSLQLQSPFDILSQLGGKSKKNDENVGNTSANDSINQFTTKLDPTTPKNNTDIIKSGKNEPYNDDIVTTDSKPSPITPAFSNSQFPEDQQSGMWNYVTSLLPFTSQSTTAPVTADTGIPKPTPLIPPIKVPTVNTNSKKRWKPADPLKLVNYTHKPFTQAETLAPSPFVNAYGHTLHDSSLLNNSLTSSRSTVAPGIDSSFASYNAALSQCDRGMIQTSQPLVLKQRQAPQTQTTNSSYTVNSLSNHTPYQPRNNVQTGSQNTPSHNGTTSSTALSSSSRRFYANNTIPGTHSIYNGSYYNGSQPPPSLLLSQNMTQNPKKLLKSYHDNSAPVGTPIASLPLQLGIKELSIKCRVFVLLIHTKALLFNLYNILTAILKTNENVDKKQLKVDTKQYESCQLLLKQLYTYLKTNDHTTRPDGFFLDSPFICIFVDDIYHFNDVSGDMDNDFMMLIPYFNKLKQQQNRSQEPENVYTICHVGLHLALGQPSFKPNKDDTSGVEKHFSLLPVEQYIQKKIQKVITSELNKPIILHCKVVQDDKIVSDDNNKNKERQQRSKKGQDNENQEDPISDLIELVSAKMEHFVDTIMRPNQHGDGHFVLSSTTRKAQFLQPFTAPFSHTIP